MPTLPTTPEKQYLCLASSSQARNKPANLHQHQSSMLINVSVDLEKFMYLPSRVAQLVARLTHKPEVRGSIPGLHTFVSPSTDSRTVVSYRRKYVPQVLVKRLGGLSLHRKSVVRINDRPDMTIAVYHGG